jgi:hypothetical protein
MKVSDGERRRRDDQRVKSSTQRGAALVGGLLSKKTLLKGLATNRKGQKV